MVYGPAVPMMVTLRQRRHFGVPHASLSTVTTSSSPVGSYASPIRTLGAAPDYASKPAAMPPAFAVTPAPPMIVANSATVAAGFPLPALDASYYGLVDGDTPLDLAAPATLATTATATGPPGEYLMTVRGAASRDHGCPRDPEDRIAARDRRLSSIRADRLAANIAVEAIELTWNPPLDTSEARRVAVDGLTAGPPAEARSESIAIAQLLENSFVVPDSYLSDVPAALKSPRSGVDRG